MKESKNSEWELIEPVKRVRPKKKEIDIDMNPMVDLAFLLLTFFMLTTTFRQPQVMEVFYPIDQDKQQHQEQLVKESKTLTIILGEDNRLFYYQGITNAQVYELVYDANQNENFETVRSKLLALNAEIEGLVILVKPMHESNYKNFVDILDELAITNSKRYSIVDFDDFDKNLITNFLAEK